MLQVSQKTLKKIDVKAIINDITEVTNRDNERSSYIMTATNRDSDRSRYIVPFLKDA